MIFLLLMIDSLVASSSSAKGHSDANWLDSWIVPSPGIFLWTIVTFLIVLFILKVKAWKPLMDALETREKNIKEALLSAENARKEAEKVSSDYEASIKKAQAESQKIISASKETANKIKQGIEKDASIKAESMLNDAKTQINAEKDKAINDIKNIAVDLSIQVASKVIEKNLDDDDNRKLIKDAIKEIK